MDHLLTIIDKIYLQLSYPQFDLLCCCVIFVQSIVITPKCPLSLRSTVFFCVLHFRCMFYEPHPFWIAVDTSRSFSTNQWPIAMKPHIQVVDQLQWLKLCELKSQNNQQCVKVIIHAQRRREEATIATLNASSCAHVH